MSDRWYIDFAVSILKKVTFTILCSKTSTKYPIMPESTVQLLPCLNQAFIVRRQKASAHSGIETGCTDFEAFTSH